jgi:DNA-binding beta-propeller fold protein YncE
MRLRLNAAALLGCLLALLAIGVSASLAYRATLAHEAATEHVEEEEQNWLLEALPEGPCGLAVVPGGQLYVADYYHRAIERFSQQGNFELKQPLEVEEPSLAPINEKNAVCGLALDGAENLYGNEFHGSVVRLRTSEGSANPGQAPVIDPGPATGIAVDAADDLYVDRRTYVAFYKAPVEAGKEPEKIATGGALEDAYGVAVNAAGTRVYVADAASDTVELFEPPGNTPAATITGPPGIGFRSLADAALTVDQSKTEGAGHLLVVDDLKPGSEFPKAATYEFAADGKYLDTLKSRPVGPPGVKKEGPLVGEPSGIAVDPGNGDLYVTTGNSEEGNAVKYGPFQATAPPGPSPLSSSEAGGSRQPAPASRLTPRGPSRARAAHTSLASASASESVISQRGPVRVSFSGKLTPRSLPRHGTAPVGIAVDAHISGTGKGAPPQLRRIAIEINRNGRLSSHGLPLCAESRIQPATTVAARRACGEALVGEGHFAANVKLPQQSPFPSSGKVLAFNGHLHGRPAILAHIYGTQPAPTSYVLPFAIRSSHGTYGTVLEASLPQATGDWGYVTGLRMNLRRSFRYRGSRRSYLSAGCPAPAGFGGAVFPLARTSFAFAGNMTLTSVLNRTCRVRG